jgi:hypothetical protein
MSIDQHLEHLPQYISLGAGVQSSTLALMAAHGEVGPMPQAAIFADTQAEPASVYTWLDWLEKQLPFPVYRVTAGNLKNEALRVRTSRKGRIYFRTAIPFFTKAHDGHIGKITHRTCTADYKIQPLMKCVRKLAGIKRGQKTPGLVQWIGISMDELQRVKPSREPWAATRWPLIEQRMDRAACLRWMTSRGYPTPPRSACTFCPFHSNAEWRHLQKNEPEAFAEAVEFDKACRNARQYSQLTSEAYLHRSCKPLDQIDFRSDVERGQLTFWNDECSGMCGV